MIIRNLRLKNSWSQEQLADMTGLSTRTIQRIEKGDEVSLESLKLLANVFKMDIQELQEQLKTKELPKAQEVIHKDKKLIIFLSVNLLLFLINIMTNSHYLWFIFPLLGWGIPLFYKRYKNQFTKGVVSNTHLC